MIRDEVEYLQFSCIYVTDGGTDSLISEHLHITSLPTTRFYYIQEPYNIA